MRRILNAAIVAFAVTAFGYLFYHLQPRTENNERCSLFTGYGEVYSAETGKSIHPTFRTLPTLIDIPYKCAKMRFEEKAFSSTDFNLQDANIENLSAVERKLIELEIFAAVSGDDFMSRQAKVAWRLAESTGIDRMTTIGKVNDFAIATQNIDLLRERSLNSAHVDTYISNCRNDGVPVPGPISDGSWEGPINLDGDFTFFKPNLETRAWIFTDEDEGLCVSFARIAMGDEPFLGTICTNADRSKACFFDNVVYDGGGTRRLSLEDSLVVKFEDRVHILDAGENCVNCHIGDNPFILHPGTELAKWLNPNLDKTKSQQFEFVALGVSDKTWCNPNPLELKAEDSACASCHDIPHVYKDSEYCAILRFSATKTMPPNHPGALSWPNNHGEFADMEDKFEVFQPSLLKLREMCTSIPTGTCSSD